MSDAQHTTRNYIAWRQMRRRCDYPRDKDYHRYGGRGIKVCDRWQTYGNFLADMGERPAGMTIDRIDPDGDYEPSNCRWATRKQQAANRKQTSRYLTFNGMTRSVKEWAAILNVSTTVIHMRLLRNWPLDRVLGSADH